MDSELPVITQERGLKITAKRSLKRLSQWGPVAYRTEENWKKNAQKKTQPKLSALCARQYAFASELNMKLAVVLEEKVDSWRRCP